MRKLLIVFGALALFSGAATAQSIVIDPTLWGEIQKEFGEIPLTERQRAQVQSLLQTVQREASRREALAAALRNAEEEKKKKEGAENK